MNTWDEIFKKYWDNEDLSKDGVVEYLKNNYEAPKIKNNDYQVFPDKFTITYKGVEYKIPKTTFNLLNYIYENKGRVVTRKEIYDNVWEDIIVNEQTIDVHISKIKQRLPEVPIQVRKRIGIIWN